MLSVEESLDFLRKEGLAVVPYNVVVSEKEAVVAARKIGFPVVMKIVSEEHTHKTDVGGVVTHINDEEDVGAAYHRLSKISKRVMVQKQLEGVEVVVGVKLDPTFGHVVMFGLGGIFVEVLKDVSFRVCPITLRDAGSMVKEIKGSKVLAGYRGKKINLEEFKKLLVEVSRVAPANDIREMDLNPVILGEKPYIVDARLLME